jgi:hypothetical protein
MGGSALTEARVAWEVEGAMSRNDDTAGDAGSFGVSTCLKEVIR